MCCVLVLWQLCYFAKGNANYFIQSFLIRSKMLVISAVPQICPLTHSESNFWCSLLLILSCFVCSFTVFLEHFSVVVVPFTKQWQSIWKLFLIKLHPCFLLAISFILKSYFPLVMLSLYNCCFWPVFQLSLFLVVCTCGW